MKINPLNSQTIRIKCLSSSPLFISATHCPSKNILKWNWIHMDVPYAAPVWQIPPRTPSLLWLEMNVCTCTSLMKEGPASLLMDINCWPIGTEDIYFYSLETRNPPTSKDKLNVLEWWEFCFSLFWKDLSILTVLVILVLIWQISPLSSKSSFLTFYWHKTLTHSWVFHHLDLWGIISNSIVNLLFRWSGVILFGEIVIFLFLIPSSLFIVFWFYSGQSLAAGRAPHRTNSFWPSMIWITSSLPIAHSLMMLLT